MTVKHKPSHFLSHYSIQATRAFGKIKVTFTFYSHIREFFYVTVECLSRTEQKSKTTNIRKMSSISLVLIRQLDFSIRPVDSSGKIFFSKNQLNLSDLWHLESYTMDSGWHEFIVIFHNMCFGLSFASYTKFSQWNRLIESEKIKAENFRFDFSSFFHFYLLFHSILKYILKDLKKPFIRYLPFHSINSKKKG